VANYLDDLTTYSDRAIVAIGNEAYAAALKISLTGEAACEVDNVNWWQQLLSFANNTDLDTPAGNSDLRLTLLTLLVNNAKLFDVQAPQNIYGIYQPIGSGTGTGDAVWGQISGDINDQTDLIAKFNTYLLLAGGTMTGNLLLSGSTRIDRSTASQLNIGTSTASSVAIGRTGQPIQLQGIVTQGIWNGTQIGYQYGGTGLTTIGTAGQSIRVNSGATGYEFFTPGTGSGDVVGPNTSTDNAIARFDGTEGRLIQNSTVLISDSGVVTGILSLTINGGTSGAVSISAPGAIGGRTVTLQAASGAIALDSNRLDFFSATTSAQLASVISDETGTGLLVFNNTPTFITPIIGNATGTSLTLTGPLVSGTSSSVAGLLTVRNATNANTQTIRGTAIGGSRIFDLPITDPSGTQSLVGTLSGSTITLGWASALSNPMTTSGDIIYGGAAGTPTRLAGNTANAKRFLTSTAVGFVAQAPVWAVVNGTDLANNVPLSLGGTGTSLVNPAANRILGWDNATSAMAFMVMGAGISYDAGTKTISVDASGIVTSVTGTANRITITGTGSAPIINIAATYVGQSSLTTLGTITTGDWQAGIIDGEFGGTGLDVSTLTIGNSIRVSASNEWEEYTPGGGGGTVTSVGFTGGIISVATATTTPALTVAGTSGGVVYFSSTSTWASSALLAANSLMIGGGAGAAPATTTTGSGILTFLGTPSSANLAAAVTDETGTGLLVFNASPLLSAPRVDWGYTAQTANYTILLTDCIVNCTANSFTVTFPTAVGIAGRMFVVKNRGAGIITLAGNGGQTFDGVASPTIATNVSLTLMSDGANWIIA